MTPDSDSAASEIAIEALCRDLTAAYDRREECRHRLKLAEEDFDRVEEELAARLDGMAEKEIRHDRWLLTPKRTVAWRTPEDRKDEALNVIREGVPSLVRESVNASSLNAYLRREEERLEMDSPSWWPRLKSILTRTESLGLSMRKR